MTFSPAEDRIPPFIGLTLEGVASEYDDLERNALVNPLSLFGISFKWEGRQWPKRPSEYYDNGSEQSFYERPHND